MAQSLDLVFLWHMHQPDYRAPEDGEYVLPWAYLHAIKDYTDMAEHLERHPAVHGVVNFVPVLIDQLEDYAAQIRHGPLRDPLLRLLVNDKLEALTLADKRMAIETCFRVNHARTVEMFTPYRRLHALQALAVAEGDDALTWLSGEYFADLVTWYHLAWTGEAERRRNPLIASLLSKGQGYTLTERRALLAAMGEMIAGLVPRYRALAARGQIELSCSPEAHPIGPLLLSFSSAREAQPEAPLPASAGYPGGRARFDRHLDSARASHALRFGAVPRGMWPSEGGVSADALVRMAAAGVEWAATGEAVLVNTLHGADHSYERARDLYRPWQDSSGVTVFFRDDRLSDLIGFEYSKWHGQDAARHFMGELEAIMQAAPADETPLVCVMLDGENAWEYYPYNAWYFFEDLYAALSAHPQIRTTTLSAGRAGHAPGTQALPPVVAGSWVYGTFSTWIGETDKNRAWDLLASAKQSYDLIYERLQADPARAAKAEALLTRLEGSDWFWWLGDYNPSDAVANFESLFRRNLVALYDTLGLTPPPQLAQSLGRGGGAPEAGGTMRRGLSD